jgi:hypothetical protein
MYSKIRINKRLLLIYFTIAVQWACQTKEGQNQTSVLEENSKTTLNEKLSVNPDLQQAMDHYKRPEDTLKREALLFLIENIENKKGYSLQATKKFIPVYDAVCRVGEKNGVDNRNVHIPPQLYNEAWSEFPKQYYSDLHNIKAELLIENIEYAFKAWQFPWAKHLDFAEFCEYVLPYRILEEPLSPWRKYLYEQQKDFIAYLLKEQIDNPVEVIKLLNDSLLKKFVFYSKINAPYLSIEDLYQNPAGQCEHRYLLFTAMARALGLPVAIDFSPQYTRYPGSHSWTVLTNDGENKILAFNGGDKWAENPFTGFKAYRNTYKNHDKPKDTYLPYLFTNPNFIDISGEYPLDVFDYELSLSDSIKNQDIFLFVFGIGTELIPMAAGKIEDGKAIFKNCIFREEGLVVPVINENGIQKILANPVVVKRNEAPWEFAPADSARTARLVRKYPISGDMWGFSDQIKNAKIQGSNRRDFSDAKTIFSFEKAPQFYQLNDIDNANLYRYFRYLPAEGNGIHLAQLRFYFSSGDSLCIPGRPFKAFSRLPDSLTKNLFDDNIRTNFDAETGIWIGIDAGATPKKLCQVGVLPRNNWNVIEKGHEYELLVFDKGWKSLAKKKAADLFIDFDQVPFNAVMLLRDLTEGKQERVFTYQNGWQLFW